MKLLKQVGKWLNPSGSILSASTRQITLTRKTFTNKSTIGKLVVFDETCVTLEDTEREVKIYGETCIPKGTYTLKLRTEGGKHESYAKRFDFHKGMIHLQNVPGFTWIYIHYGNAPAETLGCILAGESSGKDFIGSSVKAYTRIYPKIAEAILNGGCEIEIK